MCSVFAQKRAEKRGRKIAGYEAAQYRISGSSEEECGMNLNELLEKTLAARNGDREVIADVMGSGIVYHLASLTPLQNSKFLEDHQLGMSENAVRATPMEMIRKVRALGYHTSQHESLGRPLMIVNFAPISKEKYRLIPEDRDYGDLPHSGPPLWAIVKWRPRTPLNTLQKLYEAIMKKE
jgi:hypothetical protein